MIENLDVFSFELSQEEMASIATLDKNESLFFSHRDPEIVKWLVEYGKQGLWRSKKPYWAHHYPIKSRKSKKN